MRCGGLTEFECNLFTTVCANFISVTMKDFRKSPTADFDSQTHELALLKKALVQLSLQVESKEIDLRELFNRGRKTKSNLNATLPEILGGVESNGQRGRRRSSSMEGKGSRSPLTKYWRRSSFIRRSKTKEDDFLFKDNVWNHSLSLQQQLAITALNLTAPACATILRNHRNNWVQLSGHPGSLVPAGPGTIWKKQPNDTNETWVYERLMKDVAKQVVPKFYREIIYEEEKYIEISDLLHGFVNPSVMDIKIGNRTFLESEVSNTEARNDLYKKMMKLDPTAPTDAEHEAQAMTKLRYMDVREQMSSSHTLSFRIEALKMSASSPITDFKVIHTEEEVVSVLSSFIQMQDNIRKQIVSRLKTIRNTFENSEFFKVHEVVGSSILIVYDSHRVGAWIIDFAKTCRVPEGVTITHRREWSLGNHEEGYLSGVNNLIKCFEEIPISPSPSKSKKLKMMFKS